MEKHFIKNVEFENFKCFKDLKVKSLKRVNLIGGKNNIGKTSFMEGLELFLSSKDTLSLARNIYFMIRRRQQNIMQDIRFFELDIAYNRNLITIKIDNKKLNIEYFDEYVKKVDNRSRMIEYSTEMLNESLFDEENFVVSHEPALKLSIGNDTRILPDHRIDRPIFSREDNGKKSVNFISSCTTEERQIATYYGNLATLNQEEYLNKSLQLFDENILTLKLIPTERDIVLKLLLKNMKTPVLLSSLGEGMNRYIAILCAIWASKDGYLFIDEIENGIHYANYEKLWEVIFEAAKMANCQIFTTTHSKECIEAFNRVNNEDEGIYLEFYRNQKNGLIVVKERDNEQLHYALSHNSEMRG